MDKLMLLKYFLSAFILGIVVAIPPGSVTVIACQRALQFGFRNSVLFSMGSCVSDVFYIILVYFGIANLFSGNKYFKIVLWVICGSLLIFIGISSIIFIRKKNDNYDNIIKFQNGKFSTFISGILITLTNPMTIIGWLAIAGNFFLIWNDKFQESRKYGIITIMLIMAGVLIWFLPLTYIVSRFKKIINEKLKMYLVIISNLILIIFGLLAYYYSLYAIFSRIGA
jgi:L-lysine exporter family protein LysE/ArgO